MTPEKEIVPSADSSLPAQAEGRAVAVPEPAPGLDTLVAAISPVLQPFAKAEQMKQTEETKRHILTMGVLRLSVILLFCFGLAILILCGIALSLGKDSLVEKLVIAFLSFLGGLGTGRMVSPKGKRSEG